jgi:hypothetical protein
LQRTNSEAADDLVVVVVVLFGNEFANASQQGGNRQLNRRSARWQAPPGNPQTAPVSEDADGVFRAFTSFELLHLKANFEARVSFQLSQIIWRNPNRRWFRISHRFPRAKSRFLCNHPKTPALFSKALNGGNVHEKGISNLGHGCHRWRNRNDRAG